MAERAAWCVDEVEARWQQLRRDAPRVRVLEVEWSKACAGSFEAAAVAIAAAAGLELRAGGPVHRRPAGRKEVAR